LDRRKNSEDKGYIRRDLPMIRVTKDPMRMAARIREALGGESETAAHKIPSEVASTSTRGSE
jgi:hypothetical protein